MFGGVVFGTIVFIIICIGASIIMFKKILMILELKKNTKSKI